MMRAADRSTTTAVRMVESTREPRPDRECRLRSKRAKRSCRRLADSRSGRRGQRERTSAAVLYRGRRGNCGGAGRGHARFHTGILIPALADGGKGQALYKRGFLRVGWPAGRGYETIPPSSLERRQSRHRDSTIAANILPAPGTRCRKQGGISGRRPQQAPAANLPIWMGQIARQSAIPWSGGFYAKALDDDTDMLG